MIEYLEMYPWRSSPISIFTLLIFDPLKDVVDDATSGSIVEESVFVVDNETVSNKTQVKPVSPCAKLSPSPLTDVSLTC